MIKILLTLLLCLMLVGTASAEMQVGTTLDFTLSKKVDVEDTEVTYFSQNYGVAAAYRPLDWLGLSVLAGTTANRLTLKTALGDVKFNSGVGFNLGCEVEADVFAIEIVDLTLIGSYRFSRTDLDEIEAGGIKISNPLETIIQTQEWEIGLLVSKDLGLVTPYAGLVYSDLRGAVNVNLSDTYGLNDYFKAKSNLGLRIGLATKPINDISVSVDGKFIDCYGVGGQLTYRF